MKKKIANIEDLVKQLKALKPRFPKAQWDAAVAAARVQISAQRPDLVGTFDSSLNKA